MDLHPQLELTPRAGLIVTASWQFFWRQQLDDGVHAMPGNLLRSGEGIRARFVGHSPGVKAEWQVSKRLSFTANASHFTAGPFIRESGPAGAIGFVAAWATYRF